MIRTSLKLHDIGLYIRDARTDTYICIHIPYLQYSFVATPVYFKHCVTVLCFTFAIPCQRSIPVECATTHSRYVSAKRIYVVNSTCVRARMRPILRDYVSSWIHTRYNCRRMIDKSILLLSTYIALSLFLNIIYHTSCQQMHISASCNMRNCFLCHMYYR